MNIGGYDVGQIFHIGATGPVWRTRTDTGEALLSLRAAGDGEPCLERWKAWASITSRHVVALRDVARSDDGRWAIVYDYVAGRPLDAEIGSPDLRPIATRRQIIEGIAAGVSALHSAGIVHGDLTPSNIIVTPSGRAVIIDLIDELGEGDGTPGWSQGLSGQGADRACLRQLAHLLHMDEALAELGFDEPNDCLADATPVVDDPVEHPISREPVDPERVIADLRAAALREDTLRDARPERPAASTPQNVRGGRQEAQRGRRRALGVLAMGLMAIIAGVSIMAYGLLRSGVSDGQSEVSVHSATSQSLEQSAGSACDVSALSETINHAIRTRDEAVVAGDPTPLESVLGGELLDQDKQRIATMQSDGVRVSQLSSRIDDVSVLACEPGAIDVSATLTVLATETCRAGTCEKRSQPQVSDLRVRVDPVSGKVVKAEPVDQDSGAAAQ